MTFANLFRHQNICGKDVFVVDDHHTDVHEAFLDHAHLETIERGEDAWALARDLAKRLVWQDYQSLHLHILTQLAQ